MNCKECGYIKDEYKERMSYCDKYFPGYYSEDDIAECCYCVKTDGRLCWTGTCDKFPSEKIRRICNRNPKKRRSTKRERDKKYKERMKHLYSMSADMVTPVDRYGHYVKSNDEISYYRRVYYSKRAAYHKKQSNKAIRKNKNVSVRDRGNYKKVYDVEWEIH